MGDKSLQESGATFEENDEKISHQICDRPLDSMSGLKVGRQYIQPQWIFDSVNRRQLIPIQAYLLGADLPPHLSPFIAERRIGDYIPPEEKQLLEKEADKDDAEQKSSNHDPEKGDELNEDESTSEEDSEESPPKKDESIRGEGRGSQIKDEEIKTQNEEE